MFKKVVPLSALVATAMGAVTTASNPSFVPGTWIAGTVPTTGPGATTCCYITAGASTVITNDATPSLTATSGIADPAPNACVTASLTVTSTTGGNLVMPLILSTTAATAATRADAYDGTNPIASSTAKGATLTVSADGSTLSYVPVNVGTPATACTAQTFTRSGQAKISDVDGKYTVAAGTGSGASTTCCFLDQTNGVTVTTTGAVTLVSGKYASSAQCTPAPATNGGTYARDLVASATTGTATDYLSAAKDTFTVNSDKSITFVPQGKTAAVCSQTLTYVSSSAGRFAAITPVVVGAAVLGLAVL